tara:strand:- start:700 stop:927 length:228 start_codon:yes stop_codon:yes gene_type:complete
MSQSTSLVGKLLLDNGRAGIIMNEIKSGTWSEEPLFNWTTSYEIRYADGTHCVMTEASLRRMIKNGIITILEAEK